jgi:hypothetical protein
MAIIRGGIIGGGIAVVVAIRMDRLVFHDARALYFLRSRRLGQRGALHVLVSENRREISHPKPIPNPNIYRDI